MAANIIEELDKINEAVRTIKALAECSCEQAFPDEDPPHWAVVLRLLSTLAEEELEKLHYRLDLLLNGPREAK